MSGRKWTDAERTAASVARRGIPKTPAQKAAMSAAQKGRVMPKEIESTCLNCGKVFWSSQPARSCSRKCKRARLTTPGSWIHRAEFRAQEQRCAICGRQETLVGDHDHATGTPRGVLCSKCNSGLGMFKDDQGRMNRMADYIETHQIVGYVPPNANDLATPLSDLTCG